MFISHACIPLPRFALQMHTQVRKVNFGAGPAALSEQVLREFNGDLLNFRESGVGVGELSHRSELFEEGILGEANGRLARLCDLDLQEWAVLWMAGGGTGQFAAVPLNFSFAAGKKAVYLVTGVWSEKAAEEARKLVGPEKVIVIDLRSDESISSDNAILRKGLKSDSEWMKEFREKTQDQSLNYVYYCDNETVDGIELPEVEYFQSRLDFINAVFVVDASSNFLSRELPRRGTGMVFAGVQKNLGAAGVTVVLLKKNLLTTKQIDPHFCPSVLDYRLTVKNNSMLNTPPVMAIHLCNLVLKDLEDKFAGGLRELNEASKMKADELYRAIEESEAFYCPVMREFRSRMNVIFKGKNPVDEEAFLKRAEGAGMIQLRGHRSVGGLRASLYNAVTLEQVRELVRVLKSEV